MIFAKEKLCFIINGPLNRSGVTIFVFTLVKYLKDFYEITLVAQKGGNFDNVFLEHVNSIFYLEKPIFRTRFSKVLFKLFGEFAFYNKQLKRFFAEREFSILHINAWTLSGVFSKIGSRSHIRKIIVHCHGTLNKRGWRFFNKISFIKNQTMVERYCTNRISCSREAGLSFFKNDNFITLINPVDIEPLKASTVIQDSNNISLLQIGTFNERKNQLFSLLLLKTLISIRPNCKMTFVGYTDSQASIQYLEKMQLFINSNGLSDFVVFAKPDTPKDLLFKNVSYLLLPSLMEAGPIVMLESQAFNVPVIASAFVPKDNDFGLCAFLPLDVDCWKKYILEDNIVKIRSNNFDNVNPKNYCKKLISIYKS